MTETFPILNNHYNNVKSVMGSISLSDEAIKILESGLADLSSSFIKNKDGSRTLLEVSLIMKQTLEVEK